MASPTENQPYDEEFFRNADFLDGELPRPTSAPPILELSSYSLFAFQADYARAFSDIRCDDTYQDFYNSYDDPSKLPAPLDTVSVTLNRDSRNGIHDVNHQGLYDPQHNSNLWSHPLPTKFSKLSLDEPLQEPLISELESGHLHSDNNKRGVENKSYFWDTNIQGPNQGYIQNTNFVPPYQLPKMPRGPAPPPSLVNHGFPAYHSSFSHNPSILPQGPNKPFPQHFPYQSYQQPQPRNSMNQSFTPQTQHKQQMSKQKPQVARGNDVPLGYLPDQSDLPNHKLESSVIQPPLPPSGGGGANGNRGVCKYDLEGHCNRSDRCGFSHIRNPTLEEGQGPLNQQETDNKNNHNQHQHQRRLSQNHLNQRSSYDNHPLDGSPAGSGAVGRPVVAGPPGRPLYNRAAAAGPGPVSGDGPGTSHGVVGRPGPTHSASGVSLLQHHQPPSVQPQAPAPTPTAASGTVTHVSPSQPQSQSQSHSQPQAVHYTHSRTQTQTGRQTDRQEGVSGRQSTKGNSSGTSVESESSYEPKWTSLEQVLGQVYSLSKDQHGCRFLQKKLEENNSRTTNLIFNETYNHIVELMTDPFGNYLCQKLVEYCSDRQRLLIIERVASDLVGISKNMHGTRAVQKLIEHLNSPDQIKLVIEALRAKVAQLIQDLNGNHVIQRCLNRLSSEDNQFVYDAVAQSCVPVATHRHGCCVLQRCIDHATDRQKVQLMREITANALTLIQDPYGNYVVQYVLDLSRPNLTGALISQFSGHLVELSTQKFSSNVIEKCLSVADGDTKVWMIEELLNLDGESLSLMLQDPYANYVIQTALSVSQNDQHLRLVEAIRPHLPALRNTPYGKRIQNKILRETSGRYQNHRQNHHR
eukprot:TRINITY_DN1307_c0_g2_i1.p1 TRINITY_DN1307_c0_g2~~TRINITY_DN1307_c0_g2_i1.p1  ORF type:complete len:863 (+),score=120.19 TRINITY_DN1307_c0_g2_i1:34-2622(+)